MIPRAAVWEHALPTGTDKSSHENRARDSIDPTPRAGSSRRGRAAAVLLIVVVAVVMGAPTLRGTFVGGDDHRLVLNHVLVNHPSWSHALQLFTIIHRDLYQPLPLLSFSAEFAIGLRFGLFDEGLSGGAWLFHLTNITLHAINAVLVWALIVTWRFGAARSARADGAPVLLTSWAPSSWARDAGAGAYSVALVAGVLFALHPLQVEVVAWVNGRMMLMSTMFALASMISLGMWMRTERQRWVVLTILFVAACGMSKIRVGLPALLILAPLLRGYRISLRLVIVWVVAILITGLLLIINIRATAGAGLFEGAIENLHGSRVARSCMALGWYWRHYVWPTGLAAWYPTPASVRWSDPIVLRAVAIMLPFVVLMAWAAWRSRVAAMGILWFFATMASTLPIVPTRNLLAADRYMYLPIIGLVWATGVLVVRILAIASSRRSVVRSWMIGSVMSVALSVALIGLSWHVVSFYNSFLAKTHRIADLFPDSKYAWERVGWAYHSLGRKADDPSTRREMFEQSIEAARRELVHDDPQLVSDAQVVIGLSQLQLGRAEEGLAALRRAIELNPTRPMPKFHLGTALDGLGRFEEAWPWWEQAVAALPNYNPGIIRLAEAYRRLGRPQDAVGAYEKALSNNPYDVIATLGLAEIDIAAGTKASLDRAEHRLRQLLDWDPQNVPAWVNLGVVLATRGQTDRAMGAYDRALRIDPNHPTALLNMAQLHLARRDPQRAGEMFDRLSEIGPTSIEQAMIVHTFYVDHGAPDRAVQLWTTLLRSEPFAGSPEVRALQAWALALADQPDAATAEGRSLIFDGHDTAQARAALAYAAHTGGRHDEAVAQVEACCDLDDPGRRVHARLLSALERFDRAQPDVPWTFCLSARLLLRSEQYEPARVFIGLCEQRCATDTCREQVRALREKLAASLP